MQKRGTWLLAFSLCLLSAPGHAADAPANAETSRQAFLRQGKVYLDKEAYREAYEQFSAALLIKRTPGVAAQAASCLAQLGRYDEALNQYEAVLREFPEAKKETRADVAREAEKLKEKVGTLVVEGDLPDGALVFVDGRQAGKVPLQAPVRVSAGPHTVRVEKEGFAPLETSVTANGGKESIAKVTAAERVGRLLVREQHNWVLPVWVDGEQVGVTPWAGLLGVGRHRVKVSGYMGEDALLACETPALMAEEGAKVASADVRVTIALYAVTQIELVGKEQDASIRVESTPSGALLMVDYGQVGVTPWEGRLPLGEHQVEVTAKGFVTAKRVVKLERRKQRELGVVLEPLPLPPPFWTSGRVSMASAFGTSALGFGLFGVTGGIALVKSQNLLLSCQNGSCPGEVQPRLDEVHALQTAAVVGLVLGGLGAAVGTVIWAIERPKPKPSKARRTAYGVSFGLGGLSVEGAF